MPCRYNKVIISYPEVNFPDVSHILPLKPDQEKVLGEMNTIADKGIKEGIPSIPIFGHIYTGFGKTRTMIRFGTARRMPILVIVNSDPIRQGWVNTFKDAGIDAHEATGSTLGKHDVCILSIQLAVRHKFGREAYSHYGTIIADEADVLCTQNSVNELLDMGPRFFIGITATVRRNDGLDKVLDIFWGNRKEWIVRLKTFGEDCSLDLHILYTHFQVDNVYDRKGSLDWG